MTPFDETSPPDPEDRPHPTSEAERSARGASQGVQAILDAAERHAQQIRVEAEEQAREYITEVERRADQVAAERMRNISHLTDGLIDQASVVRRQTEQMITALEQAIKAISVRLDDSEREASARHERDIQDTWYELKRSPALRDRSSGPGPVQQPEPRTASPRREEAEDDPIVDFEIPPPPAPAPQRSEPVLAREAEKEDLAPYWRRDEREPDSSLQAAEVEDRAQPAGETPDAGPVGELLSHPAEDRERSEASTQGETEAAGPPAEEPDRRPAAYGERPTAVPDGDIADRTDAIERSDEPRSSEEAAPPQAPRRLAPPEELPGHPSEPETDDRAGQGSPPRGELRALDGGLLDGGTESDEAPTDPDDPQAGFSEVGAATEDVPPQTDLGPGDEEPKRRGRLRSLFGRRRRNKAADSDAGGEHRGAPLSLEELTGSLAEAAERARLEGGERAPLEPSPPEEALVKATQLAVSGSDREEIARVLRRDFGIIDPGPILDRIVGRD